jgi:hypothetical protein
MRVASRMPEITMDARAGFYALAVSAALLMAPGAMASDDAMAQADDVAVQIDEASLETDDLTAMANEAPAENDVAAVQDEVVIQPVPKRKPAAVERPVKSNLNQSARTAPVTSSPRPTRTSTRAVALPKILGSYR